MTWVATGIIGGAAINYLASDKAAGAAQDASDQSTALQLGMYNLNREDQAPWRNAGRYAVNQLSEGTQANGQFNQAFQWDPNSDPGFQARMLQGQKALERSAAATGNLGSGGFGKALNRYAQDYASNEYGNAFNRFQTTNTNRFNQLASIAGLGQTAANQTGMLGANMAGQVGNNLLGNAQYQGAAGIAQGNAIQNGFNSGINAWQNQQMMNRYLDGSRQGQLGSSYFGDYGNGNIAPGQMLDGSLGSYE